MTSWFNPCAKVLTGCAVALLLVTSAGTAQASEENPHQYFMRTSSEYREINVRVCERAAHWDATCGRQLAAIDKFIDTKLDYVKSHFDHDSYNENVAVPASHHIMVYSGLPGMGCYGLGPKSRSENELAKSCPDSARTVIHYFRVLQFNLDKSGWRRTQA